MRNVLEDHISAVYLYPVMIKKRDKSKIDEVTGTKTYKEEENQIFDNIFKTALKENA